jgi:hypothetical protein
MSEFENKRPNLVREWLHGKIKMWKNFLEDKIRIAKERKLIDEEVTLKTIKTVEKEVLERIGVIDENGKASLGELSAAGSDMGDVDYMKFSDEEDEFALQKGQVFNLRDLHSKNEGKLSLEKKQQEWYGRIIEHEVRGDAWKLEFNHYMSRSKKIREEN